MADILPFTDITLLEAHHIAKAASMYLIGNGYDVKISPIIPPGWREIPMVVKITAPDRGNVCTGERVAA
jgi:hypothetical protein